MTTNFLLWYTAAASGRPAPAVFGSKNEHANQSDARSFSARRDGDFHRRVFRGEAFFSEADQRRPGVERERDTDGAGALRAGAGAFSGRDRQDRAAASRSQARRFATPRSLPCRSRRASDEPDRSHERRGEEAG